ncbi:MAG: tRNA lysidine(34) synthetase TilS, partial [Thermoleophilia bacterium]|nr:tRNA lysidine(34) synthetase TilS [Thermoleophilia bacterium]
MDAERLFERVVAGGMIDPPAPIVAMLSGGRDSVCMLDLAVRVRGASAVSALHVNYGLRDDAGEDERHCAELCAGLGVELAIERPRRPEGPGNLQAWARDSRYAAAARLAEPLEATIVTGHTADDQVETILYRLASSPSRRALLGMRPYDGRLARPLLGSTRAETTAYCEQRGLAWREDASNADPAFARNRIRHGLLPELERVHPAAAANVLRTAALLRDEAEVLDALVGAELDGSGESQRNTISLERLGQLPPALRRLVVQRLADAGSFV